MPLYFFDIENHEKDRDDVGTELQNDNEARVHAVQFAGEYLAHNPDLIWDGEKFSVTVRNGSGQQLLTVFVTARAD